MSITCPDDFSPEDITFAEYLVPDGAIVEQMLVQVAWLDPDGTRRWRNYNATAEGFSVLSALGLLDVAKLDLIARTDLGLPIAYPED